VTLINENEQNVVLLGYSVIATVLSPHRLLLTKRRRERMAYQL